MPHVLFTDRLAAPGKPLCRPAPGTSHHLAGRVRRSTNQVGRAQFCVFFSMHCVLWHHLGQGMGNHSDGAAHLAEWPGCYLYAAPTCTPNGVGCSSGECHEQLCYFDPVCAVHSTATIAKIGCNAGGKTQCRRTSSSPLPAILSNPFRC